MCYPSARAVVLPICSGRTLPGRTAVRDWDYKSPSNLWNSSGGRIWVESTVREASTFHFTVEFRAGQSQSVVEEATTALRAMIVDGDSQSRLDYANLFSQRGVKCALAGDVSTTGSIVKWANTSKRPFDFLLFDRQVPGIEDIQNTFGSDIGQTPVIFISDLAREDNETAAEGWSPPSSWVVLPRTFSHSELWDVILSAVSRLRPNVEYLESPKQSDFAKSKKVLLVEDVAAMQLVTLGMLEHQPLDATVVSNGKEALDRLAVESFDAVLMDLQMPVMGGLEATELIRHREKESGAHTPVIGLTAHPMEGTKKTCMAAGMDDFLTKPISPERLVSTLAAVLDESH